MRAVLARWPPPRLAFNRGDSASQRLPGRAGTAMGVRMKPRNGASSPTGWLAPSGVALYFIDDLARPYTAGEHVTRKAHHVCAFLLRSCARASGGRLAA